MKVLIGTSNSAKVTRFKNLLDGYGIEIITLKDLDIKDEPEENGKTPKENAILKAKFYGKYFDVVIGNDSGLYFDTLALDDKRQPGLNIRSPQGVRLNDEEMIAYYSKLVHSLGGRVLAYYLDGVAVYRNGEIFSFMEISEATKVSAFYLVEEPSNQRHPGWPLDSISINKKTGLYFTEDKKDVKTKEDQIIMGEYRERLKKFLVESLGLNA